MFGVKTMTAKFQRVMDSILTELGMNQEGQTKAKAYVDDIMTGGKTVQEDLDNTIALVEKLTEYRMIINQQKSVFGRYSVDALGYRIDGTGRHLHPSKVDAIMKWQVPTTGKQLESFLGTANFNRPSLKHLSWIQAPLDNVRKSKSIKWTPELDKAFVAVKTAMAVVEEDPSKEPLIGTDASEVGFGYWRGQVLDEFKDIPSAALAEHQIEIIEYGSIAVKDLKKATSTGRELAAAIWTLKRLQKHLYGRKFTLYTDHSALVWLFNLKKPNSTLLRWLDLLMSLEFDVIHWKGTDNTVADALSRPSCLYITGAADTQAGPTRHQGNVDQN
jgi:polyhydroxyalkanoate synthesis regulator phasin